jgi:hypothetical protein
MISKIIDIRYELDEYEVQDIVIEELQEYIKLLLEFLSDPEHYEEEERQETIESVVHLKAVLKMYDGRSEYEEFIKGLET